jgi:signal transduction histidine kinase
MSIRHARGGAGAVAHRRRFWILIGAITLAWVLLVSAGVAFSMSRQQELAAFMRQRVPPIARGMQQLFDSMRLRALLAGARDRLDVPLSLETPSPDFRLWLLQPEPGGYRVVHDTEAPNTVVVDEGKFIKTHLVVSGDAAKLTFWPEDKPDSVFYCAAAEAPRIACTYMSLATVREFISASAGLLEHQLTKDAGEVLIRSPGFDPVDGRYLGEATFVAGDATLVVTAQPGLGVQRIFGLFSGYYFAAASSLVYGLVLMLVYSRQRYLAAQLALQHAVEHSQTQGEDLVRATLRNTATSAGVLVWLLHENERLELIGPWQSEIGMNEGETTLRVATRVLNDSDTVYHGLVDAVRTRTTWSRLMTLSIDGEVLTYQGTCSALFDSDGRFIAMLGVSSNITAALATQAQVMKDDAYRSAQTSYLRHMAKEVSGPAMHVQAVVDLLRKQVVNPNPDQARLLGLAAAEARRLSDVVRGSLELMNLRGTNVQDELRPLQLDSLVSSIAKGVAAREGDSRRQTLSFVSTTSSKAMAHRQSFVSMMNILLANAFLYSPRGGEVRVRLHEENGSITVEIEDAGPGMREEELARLGEPFFRGVASIGIPGSGLGVATALELANHTKSSIRFQNCAEEERGLLVTVTLSLAR